MLTMDQIKDIRFRYFVKGENLAQISKALNMDWKTVQKYVDMTNFNEPAPMPVIKNTETRDRRFGQK